MFLQVVTGKGSILVKVETSYEGSKMVYDLTKPKMREDHKCVQCGNELPERSVQEEDPFCSNICARGYFDNPIPAASFFSNSSGNQ